MPRIEINQNFFSLSLQVNILCAVIWKVFGIDVYSCDFFFVGKFGEIREVGLQRKNCR